MRNTPKLQPGQFALVMAEGATGHVLLETGQVSVSESDTIYKVFSDIKSATEYIRGKQQENDTWEFSLKDHNGELVKYFPAVR